MFTQFNSVAVTRGKSPFCGVAIDCAYRPVNMTAYCLVQFPPSRMFSKSGVVMYMQNSFFQGMKDDKLRSVFSFPD